MKNIRRVLSLVMALAMVMTLAIGAFAAEDEAKTVIKVPDTVDTENHTYVAYQILAGDVEKLVENNVEKITLTNITWGKGISDAGKTAITGADTFKGCTTAKDVADALTDSNVKEFAKLAAAHLIADAGVALTEAENEVPAGYYLIVDEADLSGEHHAKTAYILQVVGEVTLKPKNSVPTVDKKQKTEDAEEFTDSPLDTYIGATVEYELTGTLPSTLATYDHYWYEFHDTLSKGLTLTEPNDFVVKIGDVTIPATIKIKAEVNGTIEEVTHTNYTVTTKTDANTGATTIDVTLKDLHNLYIAAAEEGQPGVKFPVVYAADKNVVVTYSAVVNDNAVIGNPGNPNDVYLEFSNNPNKTGDGTDKPETGETPKDIVFVFTYEVDGTKVDKADKDVKLKGAEFQLQRSSDSKWYSIDENGKPTWISYDKETAKDGDPVPATITSNDKGEFGFKGLDAGEYKLWETKAPAGYDVPADPFTFTIAATFGENKTSGDPEITKLTIQVGTEDAKDGNVGSGIVEIEIENTKGAILPSTGGMGTTLFYIVGAILVLTSSVLLITKKRMA